MFLLFSAGVGINQGINNGVDQSRWIYDCLCNYKAGALGGEHHVRNNAPKTHQQIVIMHLKCINKLFAKYNCDVQITTQLKRTHKKIII